MIDNAILHFVSEQLSQDHSGHNHQHAERVVRNAIKIMAEEGGDEKIILSAAWLHDCIDKKLFSDIAGQISKIEELLKGLDYSKEEMEEVLFIIQNISYNGGENRPLSTLNAQLSGMRIASTP